MAQEYFYKEALAQLRDLDVDFRILSNHDGKEGQSYPIDRQLRVYREAINNYGVDLVIGHHPHVVHGVEHYKGGLIFYSLGNFMIRGAADMGKRPQSKNVRDFGLFARINVVVDTKDRANKFSRIEIIPVYDMHQGVHPFADPEEAYARVRTVNDLSTMDSLNRNWYPGLPKSASKVLVFKEVDGMGVVEFSP